MNIEWIIFWAFILDLLLGDPRWFPHPVKFIGRLARKLEKITRKIIVSPFLAGLLTSIIVYGLSFSLPFFLIKGLSMIHPLLGDLLSIYVVYTTIAVRDLLNHSLAVYYELKNSRLEVARKKVAMIVGRDTHDLSEKEVIRACVESVAESIVDGITAPLFFAIFLGPAWAMLYRAVNTLDSLFGHRDEKYHLFGKVPARVDDIANFLPARLTSPMISLSSLFFIFKSPGFFDDFIPRRSKAS